MQPDRRSPATRIAVMYALVAAAWILLSDVVLTVLITGAFPEAQSFALPSIVKGFFFVAVTASLLFVLVTRAIRDVWAAKERMQFLFDGVHDAVYLYPLDAGGEPGQIIDANEGAERLTGHSRTEVLQMTPFDLVKPTLRRRLRESSRLLLKNREAVFETVLIAKDGAEIPVEASIHTNETDGATIAIAVARDIRDRKRAEAERRESALASERDKRQFYRQTVLAVSDGKFHLVEPEEARDFIQSPSLHRTFADARDLHDVRQAAYEWCLSQGLPEPSVRDLRLAVGEAITNALKHASGGELYCGRDDESIWLAVVDHGEGIDTFSIPRVAFQSGYTTKASMGLGYTLMLAVCDKVMLATGPGGTTVIMERKLNPSPDASLAAIPDYSEFVT